jgi:hypothetical protein
MRKKARYSEFHNNDRYKASMVSRKSHRSQIPSTVHVRRLGSAMAEAPLAIWILFVGICFPLLILATLTLRLGLFWQAAKEAAQVSCQAQTFLTPPTYPTNATSAVVVATSTASQVLNAFPGCTLSQPVEVYIGSTPIASTATTWNGAANTPLTPAQIDTDNNVYSIKVVLVGQVQPLFTINLPYFGSIPGLTSAFPATVQEERVFENPTGLSQ